MDNDLHNQITQRAREIWEREGRPEGRAEEHWLQAEREIGIRQQPPAKKNGNGSAKPRAKAMAKSAAKPPAKSLEGGPRR
jgi:hypothetical protein